MDREGSGAPGVPGTAPGGLYEAVGGAAGIARLSAAFYARVATDPLLRPMFPKSLRLAQLVLSRYLGELLGGPAEYSERYGHPRLRARHAPFRIGPLERDAWVGHMVAAMNDVAIGDPACAALRRFFEGAASALINDDAGRRPSTRRPDPLKSRRR